jgi:hypothetical protein
MENWITRGVAAICAGGSTALFWTFGVFLAVPWREGRLLSLSAVELQVLGISLVAGLVVAWGALHILAIADQAHRPRLYQTLRVALLVAAVLAINGGMSWTTARVAV